MMRKNYKNYIKENIKLPSKEKYINFIDDNLEKYDQRYRTVRSNTYDSRELAFK